MLPLTPRSHASAVTGTAERPIGAHEYRASGWDINGLLTVHRDIVKPQQQCGGPPFPIMTPTSNPPPHRSAPPLNWLPHQSTPRHGTEPPSNQPPPWNRDPLSNCPHRPTAVANTTRTAIVVAGNGSRLEATHCTISLPTSTPGTSRHPGGIQCAMGGTARLKDTTISRCPGSGILVSGSRSRAVVEDCRIVQCSGHGVEVTTCGSVEVTSLRVTDCGRCGVYVRDTGTAARVANLSVTRAEGSGAACDDGGLVTLEGGVLRECKDYGVLAKGTGSKAFMRGCDVLGCKQRCRMLYGGLVEDVAAPGAPNPAAMGVMHVRVPQ